MEKLKEIANRYMDSFVSKELEEEFLKNAQNDVGYLLDTLKTLFSAFVKSK